MLTGRNMIGTETFTTIPPKVCKTCGKTFCIANQKYVYKIAKPHTGTEFDWYCSYTCFRVAQKPIEEARKAWRAEMERRAAAREEKALEAKRRREEEKARLKTHRKEAARQPASAQEKAQEKENVAQMIARMRRASEERKRRA